MFRRTIVLLTGLLLLVSACEPEATPLPVNLPTLPAATTTDPAPQGLRYALAPGVLPYLTDEDQRLIGASADIIALETPPPADELGTAYDILVTLGDLPDSTNAPAALNIGLRVNTALAPLDDAEIANMVRLGIDPQAVASALGIPSGQAGASPTLTTSALRADLANAGYPDGFDLTLATEFMPGAESLVQQLGTLHIAVRLVPAGEPAHLTLTSTPDTDQATDESIDLFSLPIRYRTVEGLTISFTPSGFPIIDR